MGCYDASTMPPKSVLERMAKEDEEERRKLGDGPLQKKEEYGDFVEEGELDDGFPMATIAEHGVHDSTEIECLSEEELQKRKNRIQDYRTLKMIQAQCVSLLSSMPNSIPGRVDEDFLEAMDLVEQIQNLLEHNQEEEHAKEILVAIYPSIRSLDTSLRKLAVEVTEMGDKGPVSQNFHTLVQRELCATHAISALHAHGGA